ncbi:hypothetical protein OG209_40700 (plasmid) [Streptomyces sp. NBC_01383]|uniref:hypothetical protein n=1 Tax=Streptomyces sp. NBC_01383 TaxID=2903846 RepID=UPI002F911ABA
MTTDAHREFVTLLGGPLDGQQLEVTGWSDTDRGTGVAHLTDRGQFGPGGRAMYGPAESDPAPETTDRWVWEGDCP